MVCLMFPQELWQHLYHVNSTELVSKWISKKVTKYSLLLNTFTTIFCIPVLLKNVVHKAILMAALCKHFSVIQEYRMAA